MIEVGADVMQCRFAVAS